MVINPLLENVMVEIEEKVNCQVNKDGDIDKIEIKGTIYLTINDPKKNNPIAHLTYRPIKGFAFKPHPELDKALWAKSSSICAADKTQGFPAQTRLDAVKYRYTSKEEKDLPFTVNVFNSKKGNKNVITIEVEANGECNLGYQKLERLTVCMNMGASVVDIEIQKKAPSHSID